MPTSITVAPGAIQSPRTSSGLPTAATMMSARRHSAARSRVREWAMVTVALRGQQQRRHRPPDDGGAAEHQGARALQRHAGLGQQLHHARAACRAPGADSRWRGGRRSADGSRPRPWPDRPPRSPPARRSARGSGSCTRMPSTAGSAFSAGDLGEQRGLGRIGRQADRARRDAGRIAPRGPCCGHRPRSPDRRPPAPPRGPDGTAVRATFGEPARSAAATRLAVDDARASQRGQLRARARRDRRRRAASSRGWSRRREVHRGRRRDRAPRPARRRRRGWRGRPPRLGDADAQALAVGRRGGAVQARPARLRLHLHRDGDAVGDRRQKHHSKHQRLPCPVGDCRMESGQQRQNARSGSRSRRSMG